MDARFLGLLLLALILPSFFVQGQIPITTNDAFSISLNTPTCLSVTTNDQFGVTIIWSGNGTTGWTYRNQPPAFFASIYTVVIDAENYHQNGAGSTSDPGFISTAATWVPLTNTSAGGSKAMICSPNSGSTTGDSAWGPAMVYNVYFQANGTYRIWIRGKANQTANDDSVHVLYQNPGSSTVNWLTGSIADRLWQYNVSNYQWLNAKKTLNITDATWPPKMWKIWVAQREDGFTADQILVNNLGSNYTSVTGYYSQSTHISCGSNQILYVPKYGYSGADTFYYQAQNAFGTGTSSVTVYIATPFPSPSATPSTSGSPSATPSITPSTSSSPSRSPSPSSSPSFGSSPSVTPSRTPSVSSTPSVTPSPTSTPSVTPSVTASPSVTPSQTPTPTSSATPSITPSVTPNPLTCSSIAPGSGFTLFTLTASTVSNFGQTFRPLAPGLLTEFTFWRSASDTNQVNVTLNIIQGIATDSESGISIGSFDVTLSPYTDIQTIYFYPPLRLEEQRYLFLLDAATDSANMIISESVLANQYCIQDQQINSVTAAFEYCIVPDFIPSVSPTPLPSSSSVSSPSTSSQPDEASKKKKGLNFAVIGAAGGGGILILSALIVFFVLRSKRKKSLDRNLPSTNMEMAAKPSYPPTGNYHPIGTLASSAPPSVPSTRPTSYEGQNWNIPYSEISLEGEIGRGAFGVVYKGTWQGVKVAVKQSLLDTNLTSDLRIQDFFAEAELMKKLRAHPNVTQLLGTSFSPLCIVIEYVDNGSLWTWLEKNKPMEEAMQLSIARGIAAGMLYLHSEGIIHRDLAARNILLDSKMSPKVSDFGMSRVAFENKTNKTASEIGPIRWMAPEAMRQRLYNKKTDMWSYAAVLYEILTRKMPFHQYDLVHVATSVSLKELSLVPEIQENATAYKYPTVLVRIMTKCMDFDPEKRPLFENVVQMFDEQNSNQNQNISKETGQNGQSHHTEYQRTNYSKITLEQDN